MSEIFIEELNTISSMLEKAKDLYTKAKDIFGENPNEAIEYMEESDRLITEYAERYHSAVMRWENSPCERVVEEVYITDSNGFRYLDRTVVKYIKRNGSADTPLSHSYHDTVEVHYK